MKKIITITLALFIGITFASASTVPSIQETISKQMKVPAEIINENFEMVTVEFKVKPNSEVSLVDVNSQNSELKKHIQNHFSEIDFNNAEKLNAGNYVIDLYFKIQ